MSTVDIAEGRRLLAVRFLETLSDDDVMYDHPVAMTGEPMDPVLFVRWDAVDRAFRALLAGTPDLDVELLAGDSDDLMQRLATEGDPRFADVAGRAYLRIRTLQAALAALRVAPDLDGRAVHAAWRDEMLRQGRAVAPERMAWDTLTEQDRELDDRIAARLREAPDGR